MGRATAATGKTAATNGLRGSEPPAHLYGFIGPLLRFWPSCATIEECYGLPLDCRSLTTFSAVNSNAPPLVIDACYPGPFVAGANFRMSTFYLERDGDGRSCVRIFPDPALTRPRQGISDDGVARLGSRRTMPARDDDEILAAISA